MEMKRPEWILPDIETLTELPIGQIAQQLSRLNRYAGAVEFSVLRHSMLVLHLVRNQSLRCQLWALLHDAHECWTGDALKPAKEIAGLAWSNLEALYQRHVMRLADCYPDQREQQMVDDADKEACRLEMQHLPYCPWFYDDGYPETETEVDFVAAVTALMSEIRRTDAAKMDEWKQRWLRADNGHEMPLSISLLHPAKVEQAVEMRERGEHPFVPAAAVEASQADDLADWDRSDTKCLNALGGE
jgi:5'-deoxynucleotidase YfbR-like HD superfamily hydrolase